MELLCLVYFSVESLILTLEYDYLKTVLSARESSLSLNYYSFFFLNFNFLFTKQVLYIKKRCTEPQTVVGYHLIKRRHNEI